MSGGTNASDLHADRQAVRFCRSTDGSRIAYATHGAGPPLVVSTCWLNHLQHDWQSPVWRHYLAEAGKLMTMIRYDERGFGLSDRDVSEHSFEARIADLGAVVDAAGLDRFALLGVAQGGPVAIAYAHRYPQRVSRLILYGTYATHMRSAEDREMFETLTQMVRVGWGRTDAVFRRVFTNLLIPGASEEQMQWVDELQRTSTSAEVLVAAMQERSLADVTDLLPELAVPTLVLHSRGDRMCPFEEARILGSSIPGARLVALDSDNHIVLADEPAWTVFMAELKAFVEPDRVATVPRTNAVAEPLSGREIDVLNLAAHGMDNAAIAERLTLSVRTVERHLSNAYLKLGVSGRAARAAAVAHVLGH